MKYKYTYTGDDERNLPLHAINVKPGDTIETDIPINNPDFKLVEEDKQQTIAE